MIATTILEQLKKRTPSVDLVFKEIFNCFRVFCGNMSPDSHKQLSSVFFEYRHSQQIVRIKRNFYPMIITRQFKRGLYEVFLQKYHAVTKNGCNQMFDTVRQFARYDKGNLHVYYVYNHIPFTTDPEHYTDFKVTPSAIDAMMEYGVFEFWLNGQIFYLEVFPDIFRRKNKEYSLKHMGKWIIHVDDQVGVFELTNIELLDFLLCRFHDARVSNALALKRERTRII